MGNLILNFLQEQGILVVLGLMVAGGIFDRVMATRRFRKLRAGIQSLAALQGQAQQLQSREPEPAREPVHTPVQEAEPELDSQLRYLKQSLDRIAAGRDQKLEEETREHRKLTPDQEAIIADILREYLS